MDHEEVESRARAGEAAARRREGDEARGTRTTIRHSHMDMLL